MFVWEQRCIPCTGNATAVSFSRHLLAEYPLPWPAAHVAAKGEALHKLLLEGSRSQDRYGLRISAGGHGWLQARISSGAPPALPSCSPPTHNVHRSERLHTGPPPATVDSGSLR
ncbi:hypothetical protein CORC01_09164 [Colletotrichum orchidophilum]|uniref:Uncharacterized protein n=1 Tax=Colletotrichum orchidophilum TaxID=1209926 RepID=A0A1G4B2F2_9PEZI|nr:uncharacterized protein CORC01_09164 [Colletotrichum orchidophilum]OHE95574.1 hypothetical protein CORC01_09164 [Colletotrichum orchidophilum]